MKTILILILSIVSSYMVIAQEFKYFELEKNEGESRCTLFPKDRMSTSNLNSIGWKNSTFRDIYSEPLQALQKNKFREEMNSWSEEERELMKDVTYLFYLDGNLKLLTYWIRMNVNNLGKFKLIEKRVHEFGNLNNDMSYMQPYVVIPEEFHGSTLMLKMKWIMD